MNNHQVERGLVVWGKTYGVSSGSGNCGDGGGEDGGDGMRGNGFQRRGNCLPMNPTLSSIITGCNGMEAENDSTLHIGCTTILLYFTYFDTNRAESWPLGSPSPVTHPFASSSSSSSAATMADFDLDIERDGGVVQLSLLDGGSFSTATLNLLHADAGPTPFRMYNWCFLIRHLPSGRHVLWDLGCSNVC